MRCLVSGKLADRDPLLHIPDTHARQMTALARHQVPTVLRPAINQLKTVEYYPVIDES
jgi:hypothetical protein